jgi:hypothetical protein
MLRADKKRAVEPESIGFTALFWVSGVYPGYAIRFGKFVEFHEASCREALPQYRFRRITPGHALQFGKFVEFHEASCQEALQQYRFLGITPDHALQFGKFVEFHE